MTTKVCIIRHGETDWNKNKRIQGQLDIPLNDTGHAQAQAMARNAAQYHFDALYSSDLERALHTAQALAQPTQHEIIILPQLRERHFGFFQGLYKARASEQYPEAYTLYQSRNIEFNFDNGESLIQFSQRILDIFNELVKQHRNQQIAVVCHAGPLDIMYRHAMNQPLHTQRDFDIPNSALNWFRYDDQGWHLDQWDDHHHIQQVITSSVE